MRACGGWAGPQKNIRRLRRNETAFPRTRPNAQRPAHGSYSDNTTRQSKQKQLCTNKRAAANMQPEAVQAQIQPNKISSAHITKQRSSTPSPLRRGPYQPHHIIQRRRPPVNVILRRWSRRASARRRNPSSPRPPHPRVRRPPHHERLYRRRRERRKGWRP